MVKKRQSKGLDRQRQVIEAAVQAIAERGLGNVRMSDIAERAGMSPGHVTYYFGSKSELLMEAIRWSEDWFQQMVSTEIAAIPDPWSRLDRLIELSAATEAGDLGWVLWFEVWSSASNDPEVAKVHDELDTWWRTTMAGVIRYGQERGDFRDSDATGDATILSSVIDGLSIRLTLGSKGLSHSEALTMIRTVARLLLEPPATA